MRTSFNGRGMTETMGDYAETILKLVEYELWTNLQALDFLAGLSDDQCQHDSGFGLRTLHRTMFHIADVMQGWSGCVGPIIRKPSWLPYDESITLQDLRKKLVDVGESWMAAARAP